MSKAKADSKKGGLPEEEVAVLQKKEQTRRKNHQDAMEKKAEEERQKWLAQEQVYKDQYAQLEGVVAQKDAEIAKLQGELTNCDGRDASLQNKVKELHKQIAEMAMADEKQIKVIQERDATINSLKEEIKQLNETVATKSTQIDELSRVVGHSLGDRILAGDQVKVQWGAELQTLSVQIQEMQKKILVTVDELETAARTAPPASETIAKMNALSAQIDFETKEYLRTLHGVRLRTSALADALLLAKIGKTMHSNYTVDVKHELSKMDRDQLLIILDCLSFHDDVSSFLSSELPLHSHKEPRRFSKIPPPVVAAAPVARASSGSQEDSANSPEAADPTASA